MRFTVEEILAATGGRLARGADATTVESFANDSRAATPGSCFVAIEAEREIGRAHV